MIKKNHFTLTTRDSLKVYRLSGAIFYDCMNTIYKFIKPVLGNKMFILRNMEPLNKCYVWRCERDLRITRLLMLILLHSLERLIESPHWVVSLSFLILVCLLFLRLFRKLNLTHSLLFLVMSMYLSVKIGTTTWSIFLKDHFFPDAPISRDIGLYWNDELECILKAQVRISQLAFYVNLHRAVIGPSATLTGRWRPNIDLRRMLTGKIRFIWTNYMSQHTTKPTIRLVRPAKTQISLRIRAVS